MERLARLALSLCVLPIVLTGCSHASPCDTVEKEKPEDSRSANPTKAELTIELPDTTLVFLNEVSLTPEYPVYPVDTEAINVVWHNDSDTPLFFGVAFVLGKKVDDKWERVPDSIQAVIAIAYPVSIAIAYPVSAHSQRDYTYWLKNDYYNLEAGDYRIATTYYQPIGPYGRNVNITIYAEFTLA